MTASERRPGAADDPCIIRIRDLVYSAGGRRIFSGLDLDVARGSVTAIMGPSGTGKTTLLRLITGQARADAGEVNVDGVEVGGLGREGLYALRRRMGMLFQNGALLTDLDVYENIAFPLREHARLPEALVRNIVLTKLQARPRLHTVELRIGDPMHYEEGPGREAEERFLGRLMDRIRSLAYDAPWTSQGGASSERMARSRRSRQRR